LLPVPTSQIEVRWLVSLILFYVIANTWRFKPLPGPPLPLLSDFDRRGERGGGEILKKGWRWSAPFSRFNLVVT
jgi:hypothetical protein